MFQSDFDVQRAILYETPEPHPFTATHYMLLAEALELQRIKPQDHVLVASLNDQMIVMPMVTTQAGFYGTN